MAEPIDQREIEAVAAAIANARVMRRGSPPFANIREVMGKTGGEKVWEELTDDARAAIQALAELRNTRGAATAAKKGATS